MTDDEINFTALFLTKEIFEEYKGTAEKEGRQEIVSVLKIIQDGPATSYTATIFTIDILVRIHIKCFVLESASRTGPEDAKKHIQAWTLLLACSHHELYTRDGHGNTANWKSRFLHPFLCKLYPMLEDEAAWSQFEKDRNELLKQLGDKLSVDFRARETDVLWWSRKPEIKEELEMWARADETERMQRGSTRGLIH